MNFNPEQRFARDERISWRMIENEAVLVDQDEGELLRLNPIAAEIWQAIDGRRTIRDIVDHVCNSFEVSRRRAEKDIQRFLKKLVRREMAEEIAGDGRESS